MTTTATTTADPPPGRVDRLRAGVLVVTRAGVALAAVVVAAMMLSITYDALARFLFAAPTDWAYPLNSAAVLVATILAVPHLYATGGHIALDLVHRAMSPRVRRAADAVTAGATALLGLALAVSAGRTALLAFDRGLTGAGTFSIPLWVPDVVVAVSGLMLAVVALLFPPHPAPAGPDVPAEPAPQPTGAL